tara:strand:- start:135 stop:368 length:234 start_codon:yes stop_codon:yes gene_type:complete
MADDSDKALAGRGQTVGLVIAGTMVLWLAGQWAGRTFGWPDRYALLLDFAALAAFFWALVMIFQMWRTRQVQKDNRG